VTDAQHAMHAVGTSAKQVVSYLPTADSACVAASTQPAKHPHASQCHSTPPPEPYHTYGHSYGHSYDASRCPQPSSRCSPVLTQCCLLALSRGDSSAHPRQGRVMPHAWSSRKWQHRRLSTTATRMPCHVPMHGQRLRCPQRKRTRRSSTCSSRPPSGCRTP
jgi:hypothetical protein